MNFNFLFVTYLEKNYLFNKNYLKASCDTKMPINTRSSVKLPSKFDEFVLDTRSRNKAKKNEDSKRCIVTLNTLRKLHFNNEE